MTTLTIDAEFQGKIPPLTEAEFQQLKENILEAGEVYEPIVVWNGIIVDGHNRWKIVQEHPEITYKVREMNFADKWAAFDWMYKNQLGRRNLTEQMVNYLRGKLLEARTRAVGNPHRDSTGKFQCSQNENNGEKDEASGRTADILAKELGVSKARLYRDRDFANGVDSIRDISPETANQILKGETKVTKQDMAVVAKAAPEEVKDIVERLKTGQRMTKVNVPDKVVTKPSGKYSGGGTKEYREQMNRIAETASRLYNAEEKTEYKLGNLADEIRWNTDNYLRLLKNLLTDHDELVTANKEAVKTMLDDQIIEKIKLIKEDVDK